ncbi:MAG: UDP-N-acetylmuramoyl-L-alanyl-D-glutamate--2,6-diaminopimelate ligase [Anaerolineae bacterium]
MRLSQLTFLLTDSVQYGLGDPDITSITADSRQVRPGTLFVAIFGLRVDGHEFIGQAAAQGAAAIVGELPPTESGALSGAEIPYLQVANSRSALAWLAAAWHDFPARKLTVIGVTGTDGKTTTGTLIAHILRGAGRKVGLVTTVQADIGGHTLDTGLHVTTPDALDTQHYLAEMVKAGCEVAVLESTSHGLHQRRVDACEFDLAIVTNITHEHLDYHGTWDNYAAAKGILFQHLSASVEKGGTTKTAVLNAEDASFPLLDAILSQGRSSLRRLTYGLQNGAVQAADITHAPDCTTFTLDLGHSIYDLGLAVDGLQTQITTRLIGDFNIYNILAAACSTLALGVPLDVLRVAIASFDGVVGRMERLDEGQPFLAIVDFAHSPVSLQRALETVRPLVAPEGRLIAVFGSAGQRDRAKRYLMGHIGGRLADLTVITAEDPRTEAIADISAEIACGCQDAGGQEGETYWRVDDRAAALAFACRLARTGDVVIACGKGHERSMCFGVTETPWNEQEAMRAALRAAWPRPAAPSAA